LIKTVIDKEESLPKENTTGSLKETPAEPAPQSSDTQPKRVVDSQIQTIFHRNRESAKIENVHPTVAQIEDMHFYNINTKMELRRMEHHTKTLIKEAKETQETPNDVNLSITFINITKMTLTYVLLQDLAKLVNHVDKKALVLPLG
jgi:hypothetical protein